MGPAAAPIVRGYRTRRSRATAELRISKTGNSGWTNSVTVIEGTLRLATTNCLRGNLTVGGTSASATVLIGAQDAVGGGRTVTVKTNGVFNAQSYNLNSGTVGAWSLEDNGIAYLNWTYCNSYTFRGGKTSGGNTSFGYPESVTSFASDRMAVLGTAIQVGYDNCTFTVADGSAPIDLDFTRNLSGNYSRLLIRFDLNGHHDRLIVRGAVNLGAASDRLQIVPPAGHIRGGTYTLLQAAAIDGGQFDSVVGLPVDGLVQYVTNTVQLVLPQPNGVLLDMPCAHFAKCAHGGTTSRSIRFNGTTWYNGPQKRT